MSIAPEQEIARRNSNNITATVTAFMHKLNPHNRNGVLDAEDLRQEVTITFMDITRRQ